MIDAPATDRDDGGSGSANDRSPPRATVEIAEGCGRIVVTGRTNGSSPVGAAFDLDGLAARGVVAVLLLDDDRRSTAGERTRLAAEVARRHMDGLQLTLSDGDMSSSEVERTWQEIAPGLVARLYDGFDVVVHDCGDCDRGRDIAARLAANAGRDLAEMSEGGGDAPSSDLDATRDRAIGALVGLAVGDAIGTTLEFEPRDDRAERLTDMIGGGPFHLPPGGWTDDTAMALALADSLAERDPFDPEDLMDRFVDWMRDGAYAFDGRCFDIGITTRVALERWLETGDPLAGSTSAHSAGNGSLMRLSPVAIRHWNDAATRREVAALQSRTTHGTAEAVDACVLFADLVAEAVAGRRRAAVLAPRHTTGAPRIVALAAGAWRGKPRAAIRGSGWVVEALEAALWCVGRTATFADAVLLAANLRDDADTTAAITGQLAGALYGAEAIPREWRHRLAWGSRIAATAETLWRKSCP